MKRCVPSHPREPLRLLFSLLTFFSSLLLRTVAPIASLAAALTATLVAAIVAALRNDYHARIQLATAFPVHTPFLSP